MINLIIKNGLGNQMFQYAFARYLQEEYHKAGSDEQMVINPYFIQHRVVEGDDERDMSIHHLLLNKDVRILNRAEQKRTYRNFCLRILFATPISILYRWKVKHIKPTGEDCFMHRAKKGIYYTYQAYTFFKNPLSKRNVKYIFGFFQDERNFHSVANVIKKELRVKDTPSEKNEKMIATIQKSNSVCLHIRRGDYLNPKWTNLQVCDFDYYNNAINYVLDNVDNPTFYVFSNTHDDLEWIKDNYKFYDKNDNRNIDLIYVDLSNPDYEELRLMYSCQHFIISNSTFSWWAAYLGISNSKIVLAPSRWHLGADNDDTIYLKEWIKI